MIWATLLMIWILILVDQETRNVFLSITGAHPYWGGFIKFFILASMGDMLGVRIFKAAWIIPDGFFLRAFVWGILGIMITLVFTVYSEGVACAQEIGRLPFAGSRFALALFTSVIMNLTFGPMMYIYHKFGDLLIDITLEGKKGRSTSRRMLEEMVSRIDWYHMVRFSWLTTCLFVWIPCHTIVFLLPPEYRVLASAFLSILLGILVAVSKKKSNAAVYTK